MPTGARAASSMPSRSSRVSAGARGAHLVERDLLGQEPQLGPGGAAPRLRHGLHQVLDAGAEGGGGVVAVDARQRREHVVLRDDDAAARSLLRHVDGDLAVELGVRRVAQAQLDPGAEEVLDLRAEVHPPRGAGQQVDTERQAAAREGLQPRLELVELGADRAPAVDDQEDVAVAVVRAALEPARAVRLDRVDLLRAEVPLAGVDDALDLGDDAPDHVGLAAGRPHRRRAAGRASGLNVPPPKSRT